MNSEKVLHPYLFFILFLFFSNSYGFVGPVVTGQPLWGISKRIGETVDIIESKVCELEFDVSILGETLCSKLDELESSVDQITACGPTILSSADIVGGTITIAATGNYCLSEDVTATFTITANCVSLDLNKRCVTGIISIDSDDVTMTGGNITPPAPTAAPEAGISVTAASDRAKISDVVVTCADTTTDGVAGRTGVQINGNDTQLFNCTIKSGAGESTGAIGTNGGIGILVSTGANNVVIKHCFVSTGNGGDGTATGGSGGNGISIESNATETEVTDTTILFTGNGGDGGTTNGDGGHGFNVASTALDTVIRNCTIRNTGAAGAGGGTAGTAGHAILDTVTTVANLTLPYSNFAHNIANSINYALQGFATEQGVAIANPPTPTIVNPFANVFV